MENFAGNKAIIIINPNAGPKRLISLTGLLRLYRNVFDYSSFRTLEEFRSFIRSNLDRYDIFIAAGGDGTVNSLAAELAGTGKILAVLPLGSGNGFAREMGFRKNIVELVRAVKKKEQIETDVLYLNERICINVAGIGFDSFVAHDFHDLGLRGFWTYVTTALKIASRIRPFPVSIEAEGIAVEDMFYMVSFANTRQFGNRAFIAPGASPNDGKFNIVLVKPFPWYLFPVFAVRMLKGSLKETKCLKYIVTGGPVTISSPENRFHIDGEPLIIDGKIRIKISPGSLVVLRTRFTRWK